MVDMGIMERDLLKLMLSQDTSEDMAVMEVMDMDVDTMERGKLKLLLKLMLSQDTSEDMAAMVIAVDMVVMDTDVDTMERGTLRLSQDILDDMVVMVVDMDMVVTDMVDMVIAVNFSRIFFTAKRPNIQCSFPL